MRLAIKDRIYRRHAHLDERLDGKAVVWWKLVLFEPDRIVVLWWWRLKLCAGGTFILRRENALHLDAEVFDSILMEKLMEKLSFWWIGWSCCWDERPLWWRSATSYLLAQQGYLETTKASQDYVISTHASHWVPRDFQSVARFLGNHIICGTGEAT